MANGPHLAIRWHELRGKFDLAFTAATASEMRQLSSNEIVRVRKCRMLGHGRS
jgi:hypothetical protein